MDTALVMAEGKRIRGQSHSSQNSVYGKSRGIVQSVQKPQVSRYEYGFNAVEKIHQKAVAGQRKGKAQNCF